MKSRAAYLRVAIQPLRGVLRLKKISGGVSQVENGGRRGGGRLGESLGN